MGQVMPEIRSPASDSPNRDLPTHAERSQVSRFCVGWGRQESFLVGVLVACAIATRFWHLGYPDEPVFDEIQFVGQSLAYLRGEQFLVVHPPLAELLMASAVALFGQHSWIWRLPSACLGVALIPVTFLLGREMFHSRLAATLCAAFVLCDGMFMIHSRLGMLEIFHLTFTATSYLLLFQFLRAPDAWSGRRKLLQIALVSGLAMASKLMIPVIGFLLVTAFTVNSIWHSSTAGPTRIRRIVGALILLASVSALVYFSAFLPQYWLGWWGGIGALVHYYREVIFLLRDMAETASKFISPWWSWPLMLRAPIYWQNVTDSGQIAVIWEGGNPVLWWGSLGAVAITVVTAFTRPSVARSFALMGYLGYMLFLASSRHPFFLYIYMAPLYLQYLLLAGLLAECWSGESRRWEHLVILLSLVPACYLGFGFTAGISCLSALAVAYAIASWRFGQAGKFVCIGFVTAALAAFIYFIPLWLAVPLEPTSYGARIWLRGPGLAKWM